MEIFEQQNLEPEKPYPKIIIIAAVTYDDGLGYNNDLLVKCKEDMNHFKETTTGHVVVMGRKTLESMGNFVLPNRINYILSTNTKKVEEQIKFRKSDELKKVHIGTDFDLLLDLTDKNSELSKVEKVFIIGGAEVYEQFINVADEIILTKYDCLRKADVFFPAIPETFELTKTKTLKPFDENDFEAVAQYYQNTKIIN